MTGWAVQEALVPATSPEAIGRAATLALHDELALSPKPGLVTPTSPGSHEDMDADTFMRSLFALRRYFVKIAQLGWAHAPFEALERCGIEAEARMLKATGGVNTHRGAVFQLGLLCAAAGSAASAGMPLTAPLIQATLLERWGPSLAIRARRPAVLPGGLAARRLGLRSASAEAALGFPVVFNLAAPALRRALDRGLTPALARLDTLFRTIAVLDDSNLAHRGGMAGLRFAQQAARDYLAGGGVESPDGLRRALSVGEAFVARRLSPGGAADMLASTCWLLRLGAL